MASIDQLKFTDAVLRITHLEKPNQLHQIYEWVKTGHINLAQFKGLVEYVYNPPQGVGLNDLLPRL